MSKKPLTFKEAGNFNTPSNHLVESWKPLIEAGEKTYSVKFTMGQKQSLAKDLQKQLRKVALANAVKEYEVAALGITLPAIVEMHAQRIMI